MSDEASMTHVVSEFNSVAEGMMLVSGWQVKAQVVGVTGREFSPVQVAICPSKDDADEIAALLNARYDDRPSQARDLRLLAERLERWATRDDVPGPGLDDVEILRAVAAALAAKP